MLLEMSEVASKLYKVVLNYHEQLASRRINVGPKYKIRPILFEPARPGQAWIDSRLLSVLSTTSQDIHRR